MQQKSDFAATLELNDAPNDAMAIRFFANLFLAPNTVRVATDYWMEHYFPLMVSTQRQGAGPGFYVPGDTSKPITGSQVLAAMVHQLLTSPCDLHFLSQGGMATSLTSTQGTFSHQLSFIDPVGNFALSVPLGEYIQRRRKHVLAGLVQFFQEPKEIWADAQYPTLRGQFHYKQFRPTRWEQQLYRPSLFIGCCLYAFLAELVTLVGKDGQWNKAWEAAGIEHWRIGLASLAEVHLKRVHLPSERALLSQWRQTLQPSLQAGSLRAALRTLEDLVAPALATAALDYKSIARRFHMTCHASEYKSRPWKMLPDDEHEEEEEEEDAMDICL